MFEQGEKVLAGLDGGGRALAAAVLAKNAGADLSAVTLKLFGGQDSSIAKEQAERLGIEWYEADYTDYFKEDLLAPFISAVKVGADTEPCSLCLRSGVMKYLLDEAKRVGAERVVLGSLARTLSFKEGAAVYKGLNGDESFYFALSEPHHLPKIALPLGEADGEVPRRQRACFFQEEGREDFLARYLTHKKLLLKRDGEFLGELEGVCFKSGKKVSTPKGEFYIRGEELKLKEELFVRVVKLEGTVFRRGEPPLSRVAVRLTPQGRCLDAVLEIDFDNRAVLLFDRPLFLPSYGGVAAVYEKDRLLGGGVVSA